MTKGAESSLESAIIDDDQKQKAYHHIEELAESGLRTLGNCMHTNESMVVRKTSDFLVHWRRLLLSLKCLENENWTRVNTRRYVIWSRRLVAISTTETANLAPSFIPSKRVFVVLERPVSSMSERKTLILMEFLLSKVYFSFPPSWSRYFTFRSRGCSAGRRQRHSGFASSRWDPYLGLNRYAWLMDLW